MVDAAVSKKKMKKKFKSSLTQGKLWCSLEMVYVQFVERARLHNSPAWSTSALVLVPVSAYISLRSVRRTIRDTRTSFSAPELHVHRSLIQFYRSLYDTVFIRGAK